MNYKTLKQNVLRLIGAVSLNYSVNVLCKTLKINIQNSDSLDKIFNSKHNMIVAFWHGTMLVPWFLFRNKNFVGIVSKSKDGDLLTNVLNYWHYKVLRGSSRDGGKEVMELMLTMANERRNLVITPDGPTGPLHKMKAGAVVTAKKTSTPLVLLGVGYKSKRELKSWDRFQIPKFFSRVNIIVSAPIEIDNNLSRDEVSNKIIAIESQLNELQKKAEKFD